MIKRLFFAFPLKLSKKVKGSKNAVNAVGSLKFIFGMTIAMKI